MDELRDHHRVKLLNNFAGSSELEAAEAFEQLASSGRRYLHAYLAVKGLGDEERSDIISQTMTQVWKARKNFKPLGYPSWLSMLKVSCERCMIDHLRGEFPTDSIDDSQFGEIPTKDQPTVSAIVEILENERALYDLADEVWLGVDPGLTQRDRARRIVAGHLFYSEGLAWETICDLLTRSDPANPVSRTVLDNWLAEASLVRSLAFKRMYLSSEELAGVLLGICDKATLEKTCRMAANGEWVGQPPAEWSWPETHAIVWRFRYAELVDQILARQTCTLKKTELSELFVRCIGQFPFNNSMSRIRMELAAWPIANRELGAKGLWQRLVFQYYCRDTHHHKDIGDRTVEPASQAGYNLNLGVINMWLSGGRMLGQLVAHAETRGLGK